jgi:hypothetical protein
MPPDISPLEKLSIAYNLVGEVLSLAPELYDSRLDQALMLIHFASKRARRIPRLRPPKNKTPRQEELCFF